MRKRTTTKTAVTAQTKLPVDWTAGANPEQAEVIMHETGPCRVLACAGAGKTHSIIRRVARLVTNGNDPARILLITFTRKAMEEMGARLTSLGIRGVRVATFHSLASQIMKADNTPWARFETRESTKYEMKDVTGFREMDWKGVDVNKLMSFVGMCKAYLVEPGDEQAETIAMEFGLAPMKAREAYQRYQDRLNEKRIMSYDDYIVNIAKHFEDEDNRATWAARFDHVLCDEDQDTNPAQQKVRDLLARDHRNLMVIGDVFQSIYRFRGAKPELLANFDRDWPGARTITLPRNYRSGKSIIAAANGIVTKSSFNGVSPIAMIGERDHEGSAEARVVSTFDDEGNEFATWIKTAVDAGDRKYGDHCALVRTNAQTRALEEALIKHHIPYVVVGSVQFYDRKEVKDLLAYLRIAADRGEIADIKRCINAPFRFLGNAFVDRVMAHAEALDDRSACSWSSLIRAVGREPGIQSRQVASAEEWARLIETTRSRMIEASKAPMCGDDEDSEDPAIALMSDVKRAGRPAQLLENIIRTTRYIEWISKEEGEESLAESGAANVREMCRVAERFATVDALLDYIAETMSAAARQREDRQAGGDRVLIMSTHRSKGLEWPRVWVAGFNEMIMPHAKGEPEEERRLAYVAVTRARDELVVSCVRSMATRAGIKEAMPSRYLADSGIKVYEPMNGAAAE